ncbi:protoporphyrinogen oxidase HemJ [Rhizomicrobium electricum]|uniref:Protoporphyrinogen IX oxidase n=1 Tax=Rhizomicrobium electricum TaxID=480070 RepID=A0ABN1F2K6_9PROT|nr:protoporphyrinogen oxidase HemJ [Rhizomicrobium electricum]NIJ49225.1 putative membrane protein [Rhizomicrobium electricum]
MKAWLLEHYLTLKAFHIIAVIAWMSGLFYLPRLFVYHTETRVGAPDYLRFAVMEKKLLAAIMAPAMGLTWIFGLSLAWAGDWWQAGWFHTKLALVLVMTAIHITNIRFAKDFASGRNVRTGRFFRLWNELPTLLMIAIVILVVTKAF